MVKHEVVVVYDFDEVDEVLSDDEVQVLVAEVLVEVDLLVLGNCVYSYSLHSFCYDHDYKKTSKYC
jgi:hypothetical protein